VSLCSEAGASAAANSRDRWFLRYVPPGLFRLGPYGLFWWQWLALPVIAIASVAVGAVLSRATRRLLSAAVRRTSLRWDDLVVTGIAGPITLSWTLVVFSALLPWLDLKEAIAALLRAGVRAGVLIAVFWSVLRVIDIAREGVIASDWAKDRAGTRSLFSIVARVAKFAVLALAVVALLSELGYPVASLVAGLGIGGVAVALGAQKTFENLFGTFSIGADQPFREGDFVRIEDFVGTIEAIGLRSTRIRTLDRTIITLPNGKLSDMRVETFAARDRLRLACNIGLVYGTTPAQMRAVLNALENALRAHPKIWSEVVVVRFKEFGDSSLNIEVMAWFTTADWGEFMGIREEMLLSFMEIVEREGSSFAFPTRTVHVVSAGT
jgi:MscS family membrane protein